MPEMLISTFCQVIHIILRHNYSDISLDVVSYLCILSQISFFFCGFVNIPQVAEYIDVRYMPVLLKSTFCQVIHIILRHNYSDISLYVVSYLCILLQISLFFLRFCQYIASSCIFRLKICARYAIINIPSSHPHNITT